MLPSAAMLRRAGCFALSLATAACAGGATRAPDRETPPARDARAGSGDWAPTAPLLTPARVLLAVADDAFWVTHDDAGDCVVSHGARLEVDASGAVVAAGWELAGTAATDAVVGSLAVPARLGGGLVHWSRTRVLRGATCAGAVEPIALHGPADPTPAIRGARSGFASIDVMTDRGVLAIAPGAARAAPGPHAAVHDAAALNARVGIRIDVLARAATTRDGGASWIDASDVAGLFARGIETASDRIRLGASRGAFALSSAGTLTPLHEPERPLPVEIGKPYQMALPGARVAEREDWPWIWRDAPPIAAAAASGVELAPGVALAVAQASMATVDLASGRPIRMLPDPLPSGLACRGHAAIDGPLVVCGWDRFEGRGGHVLRVSRDGALSLEQSFAGDGWFLAADDGALGFAAPCRARAARIDDDDGREDHETAELRPPDTICVRTAGGVWVERTAMLEPGEAIVAWALRADGAAAALAIAEPLDLPPPAGAPAVRDQGGVRVVRIAREAAGYAIRRGSQAALAGVRGVIGPIMDRRFRLRSDGGIAAWVTPADDDEREARASAGATIDPDGRVLVHDLPSRTAAVVATGDFALASARDGALYQSTDHGRTWQRAGMSPVPPSVFSGACSRLGCAFGPVARIGWGPPRGGLPAVVARETPRAPRLADARPRLACEPDGAPELRRTSHPVRKPGPRRFFHSTYDDEVELVDAPQGASPSRARAEAAEPALVWREPLDPLATMHRTPARALADAKGRPAIAPLFSETGSIALLVLGDEEHVASGATLTSFPPLEARRSATSVLVAPTGRLEGGARVLVLSERQRRLAVEEHGPQPAHAPALVGADRALLGDRAVALASAPRGVLGILVADGPSGAAAVAPFDRALAAAGPFEPLAAWGALVAGDRDACAATNDDAWEALLGVDGEEWLAIDPRALPGVELSGRGLALVRWGRERVCVDGLDLPVKDLRRGKGTPPSARLVVRFRRGRGGGAAVGAAVGAAILDGDLRQPLRCSLRASP